MHGGTFWVGSFAEKLSPFSKAHLSSLNPFKLGRENKKLCFWRHCSGVLWESFRWYQELTDFGSKLIAGQMLSWLENLPRYALWISQEIFLEMWKFALKCGNMEICLEIWKYAWKSEHCVVFLEKLPLLVTGNDMPATRPLLLFWAALCSAHYLFYLHGCCISYSPTTYFISKIYFRHQSSAWSQNATNVQLMQKCQVDT